jgi:hypothetical protein
VNRDLVLVSAITNQPSTSRSVIGRYHRPFRAEQGHPKGCRALSSATNPPWLTSPVMLIATGDLTAPNVIQSLVAVGTLLMAITTAWAVKASNKIGNETERLATQTKRSVDLAEKELKLVERQVALGTEQLDASRKALLRSSRPLIVNVPLDTFFTREVPPRTDRGLIEILMSPEAFLVVVPIRNIGSGAAVIADALLETPSGKRRCNPSNLIVAQNELSVLTFDVKRQDLDAKPENLDGSKNAVVGSWIRVEVTYSDNAGSQSLRTILHIPYDNLQMQYFVRQVTIGEEVEGGTYPTLVTAQV